MQPILYCHPDSGYSYKVALALSLLGIAFEQRHVDLAKPRDRRSPEFQAVSAHGEVPVLLIDGHTLCQSNAILDYLARHERRLDGRDEAGRLIVREWLSWEANRISLDLSHSRFGRRWGRYPADLLAWFDQRSRADLDRIERQLATTPFLAGSEATIADIASCAYLGFAGEDWAHAAGIDLSAWPNVHGWLGRLAELPGFRTPQDMLGGHEARY